MSIALALQTLPQGYFPVSREYKLTRVSIAQKTRFVNQLIFQHASSVFRVACLQGRMTLWIT